MGKYRVLEDISYMDNGVAKSVKGGLGKEVTLDDDQAKLLAGKVVHLVVESDMFPDGYPMVEPVIPTNQAVPEERHVHVEAEPEADVLPVEIKAKPIKAEFDNKDK